jgi:hypothetical protein
LNEDVPTNFDLDKLHVTKAVRIEQISTVSRYERNDEVEPEHIVPMESTIQAPGSGLLSVTLPHDSVTMLRVQVQ